MRSTLSPWFAPVLAIAVAACGTGAAPAQPTTPAPPAPAMAAPAPAAGASAPAAAPAPAAATTRPGPNVTPGGVVFNYKAPTAAKKKVYLAGNFNSWNPSDDKFLMKDDDGDGTWSITVKLAPGSYQYKYVIDGAWTKDPYSPGSAPDGFGGQNGQFDVK